MNRLADRGIVHLEIVANRAHHHRSGIQTDTNMNRNSLGASDVFRMPPHRLLHSQRRITGSHSVILVRQRRSEQSHDPVTHHLVHRTFEVVHRFHHVLDDRIEKLARFFRIAVSEQLHGTFHVSEQHRDLFALTFERTLRSQDLFGEMFRSVDFGR